VMGSAIAGNCGILEKQISRRKSEKLRSFWELERKRSRKGAGGIEDLRGEKLSHEWAVRLGGWKSAARQLDM